MPGARMGHRLPRWVPWTVLATSFAMGYGIVVTAGEFDLLGGGFLGAIIHVVAMTSISWATEGERWAKDRLATALVVAAFALVMIPLISLVWLVVSEGAKRFDLDFLLTNMVGVYGESELGGAYHAIVGTLLITGLASLISIPIGLFTAIYLVEYRGGRISRVITFLVDVMTGIPSIVAGLFAYALFVTVMGPGYRSGLIGAVALSVLMTPVVVRSVEEMLKLVPNELREAAYALGVPKWLTIVKVVLRTAIAGITTGVMIAIARVIGATAPLLITVGIVSNTNFNAFDGRMATLPVFVFRQYAQGGEAASARAWAGALTLILIVMLLNLGARLVSRYFAPKGMNR
ncbi:MAG: phosphate ABC transporter permease PstA [Actinomycetes bacterium]|nr:phosphate ABC transporter permease PstA [Actinomycetes bacterium]MDX5380545.1 phosphate ABC transporter permease PstA [Actinomycetes bacterium]MDX5399432.1 phosphate ABC transporter permease PstA [Actinomycetes bacterium]MDX5450285.1 phosphate ABC transporter permease PstA [Actinomycetes bacterium]